MTVRRRGDRSATISHTASGGGYGGLAVPSVMVRIVEGTTVEHMAWHAESFVDDRARMMMGARPKQGRRLARLKGETRGAGLSVARHRMPDADPDAGSA